MRQLTANVGESAQQVSEVLMEAGAKGLTLRDFHKKISRGSLPHLGPVLEYLVERGQVIRSHEYNSAEASKPITYHTWAAHGPRKVQGLTPEEWALARKNRKAKSKAKSKMKPMAETNRPAPRIVEAVQPDAIKESNKPEAPKRNGRDESEYKLRVDAAAFYIYVELEKGGGTANWDVLNIGLQQRGFEPNEIEDATNILGLQVRKCASLSGDKPAVVYNVIETLRQKYEDIQILSKELTTLASEERGKSLRFADEWLSAGENWCASIDSARNTERCVTLYVSPERTFVVLRSNSLRGATLRETFYPGETDRVIASLRDVLDLAGM